MIQLINMKRLSVAGLLLGVMLFSTSCDDIVDEQPVSELAADNFWRNNKDAALGIAAIYDGLQPTYRLKHYYWGEFRSDNFAPGTGSANANDLQLMANDITSGNGGVLRWDDFYTTINRANLAIKYIPQIDGFDPKLLAEAYAIRAYLYFDATRVWGAVPLFLEPVESADQEVQFPRTDAATIMSDVVIPDMLQAEELMSTISISDAYRFSQTSILALQADVYMWLGEYDNAKNVLDEIVATGEFSLVDTPEDWQNLFLNDDGEGGGPVKVQEGPELMFSIAFNINEPRDNPEQTRANRSGIFSLFFAGLPSYFLSPILENKWIEKFPIDSLGWVTKYPGTTPPLTRVNDDGETVPVYGDFRYYFSREDGLDGIGSTLIGEARLAKYNKTNYSQDLDDSDIVLYRYSGMLLLLAEAENRLNNSVRALELVNEIRTARQLPLVTEVEFGATVVEREAYILDERQIELLGEAERWWDLRRTENAIPTLNPILDTLQGGVPLTDERLLFPIFDDHLIENPNIEQNSGY